MRFRIRSACSRSSSPSFRVTVTTSVSSSSAVESRVLGHCQSARANTQIQGNTTRHRHGRSHRPATVSLRHLVCAIDNALRCLEKHRMYQAHVLIGVEDCIQSSSASTTAIGLDLRSAPAPRVKFGATASTAICAPGYQV
ncbi:hypothetical protein FA15DRAFT_374318 [Coprinopsis marcescibilis]|uniref:Uncharacterized protein n=1 Tax=Coprinopsis marcescibilis TaxID=230819 RepID=A0A5C3KA57_COPMA|nr:hypothetical protein FA15DRAFT_374318 [Coprinopsis marcescibilis]